MNKKADYSTCDYTEGFLSKKKSSDTVATVVAVLLSISCVWWLIAIIQWLIEDLIGVSSLLCFISLLSRILLVIPLWKKHSSKLLVFGAILMLIAQIMSDTRAFHEIEMIAEFGFESKCIFPIVGDVLNTLAFILFISVTIKRKNGKHCKLHFMPGVLLLVTNVLDITNVVINNDFIEAVYFLPYVESFLFAVAILLIPIWLTKVWELESIEGEIIQRKKDKAVKTTSSVNIAHELYELNKLLDAGVITQEDFDIKKSRILH